MPDLWTEHPTVVRSLLEAGAFRCGEEPRILKGRDPEWTCIVDGETMYGDLYIHHVSELSGAAPSPLGGSGAVEPTMGWTWPFVGLLVGLALGFFVGKRYIQSRKDQ